jgi:hypothetical protein
LVHPEANAAQGSDDDDDDDDGESLGEDGEDVDPDRIQVIRFYLM